MADIAVIGAGVVGVASAWRLARAGHAVTLIDAAAEPGTGASAGNAAQLSWAYADAMASPALLRHLPAIAFGHDPGYRLRWQLDPDFLLWGLRFLANTPANRWWDNTKDILALAARSRAAFAALVAETEIGFDYRVAGKLHLYPDQEGLAAARPTVERKGALGFEQRLVSRLEAEAIEPALTRYQGEIAGAIFTPGDALGDAAGFCRELTRHAVAHHGVKTLFGRRVVGLVATRGRVCALRFADRDELSVDTVVVAAGPQAGRFARDLPEVRAIRPVRGYSLTIARPESAPSVSLTDVKRKLAFASIGSRFRVAGLADIEPPGAGYRAERFEVLRQAAADVLPHVYAQSAEIMRWSGERPMTPSSKPIIAPSRRLKGVYLNLGHGMLGWTLSLGSAERLMELLA